MKEHTLSFIEKKSKVTVYGDHHGPAGSLGRASAAPTAHAEHHTEPSASPTARRRTVAEEPALSIKDLIKEFKPSRAFRTKYPKRLTASGLYRAVNKVNLRVFPGEVVVLLGANGAGKTTTLACAQGLPNPPRGAVRLLGETHCRRTQNCALVGSPGRRPAQRHAPHSVTGTHLDHVHRPVPGRRLARTPWY